MSTIKLTYHQFDVIEQRFLDAMAELIQTRPFWWHLFVQKIIGNPQITYFKDTTMIISIFDLPYQQTEIVFEIVRYMLKIRAATRVIKKKEFLIVHLYSKVIVDYLSITNKWVIIPFYQMICKQYPKFKCYLDVTCEKEETKFIIDLLIKTDMNTYWITVERPFNLEIQGVKKLKLVLAEHSRIKSNDDFDTFQFSYETSGMVEVLNSYFELLASSTKICYNM